MPLVPWYYVPEADECLLITGGRAIKDGSEFRIVKGKGQWVSPFRKVRRLTFQLMDTEVTEKCPTTQGIFSNVNAVINFRIGRDDESIYAAGPLFLHDKGAMIETQVQKIFTGHLRSIIGGMTINDIIQKRQTLATEVLDGSKNEMSRLGIVVESFQIQAFDDGDSGYIDALAAPHKANVQRDAAIAEAKAAQESAMAQQDAARNISAYEKETAILVANNKAEKDKATAIAGQAGPLQEAQSQQAVIDMQKELADRNAELAEAQLNATAIKQSEAMAHQMEIDATGRRRAKEIDAEADAAAAVSQAKGAALVAAQAAAAAVSNAAAVVSAAEAEATKMWKVGEATAKADRAKNEAAAAEGKVSLERQLIDKMPEIVGAGAKVFDGSKMTFLNGTNDATQMLGGVVAQGWTMFNTLKEQLTKPVVQEEITNGQVSEPRRTEAHF